MNTKVVKSFGLALIVAVGVLALLLATGTFSPQKAGAAPEDGSVSLSLEQIGSVDQDGTNTVKATVKFIDDEGLSGSSAIVITLGGGLEVASPGPVTVSGTGSGGLPFEVTDQNPSATGNDTITIDLPDPLVDAVTAVPDDGIEAAEEVPTTMADSEITVVIATGITAPIADEDQEFTAAVGTGTDAATNAQTSDPVTMIVADVLSSQDAGAGVSLTVVFDAPVGDIDAGDDVVIELESFQIDAPIDADAISIKGDTTANAADVSVSGSKITVEIPDMNGDGEADGDNLDAGDEVTIRVRSRAGLMNPPLAGDGYLVKVTYDGDTVYERNAGAINATLKADPESGLEGEALTVSGVGYSNGTATIYHIGTAEAPDPGTSGSASPDFAKVGSASVSDGSFSTTVTAGADFTAGENDLVARSSTGQWGPAATFTLNGAISIPDSVTKGTDLTVKVSKWSAGPITRATINGEDMYTVGTGGAVDTVDDSDSETVDPPRFKPQDPDATDPAGATEFKIRVGSGALLGEQTLVLYSTKDGEDQESAGQKNINVIGIELTVSPSAAVVGREVTVTGSGFLGNVTEIKVGEATHCVGMGTAVGQCNIAVASGGRVVAAFDVPNDARLADAGDYAITISDDNGRTGSAMFAIQERTLTSNPLEGRIGSTIELSGTGWPTGAGGVNLVKISYDGTQLSSATADSSGDWSTSINVPDDAGVGMTHVVKAEATVGVGVIGSNVMKEADHKTPDPVVTLSSAQAQRGTYVTVSGANFHTFRPVMIEIGGSDVTPAATTTEGDGSFSAEVLVPGLSLGNKNLRVTVNKVPVVEFLEIVDTPATPVVTSNDPADVFAKLISDGVLDAVWVYNNDDGKYRGFIPGASDTEMMLAETLGIALTEVNSGDIGWINLNADAEFQGKAYTAGWKLVTIN